MIFSEPVLFQHGIKLEVGVPEAQVVVALVDGTKLFHIDQNGLLTMDGISPASIHYNNAVSGLVATTVQGAIDELANVGGPPPTSFVQSGNAFGASAVLGTNDNFSLTLETNNTDRITITDAGLVGIGNPTPAANLHLNGDMIFTGRAAPANAPAGEGRIYFDSVENKFKVSEDGSAYALLAGQQFLQGGNTFSAPAVLGTTDNFPLLFITNNSAQAVLDSVGNFGLGGPIFGANAEKVLQIFNGVPPTTAPADSIALYSKDFAPAGVDARLYIQSELGNAVSIGNGTVIADKIIAGTDASAVGADFGFSETRAFDDADYYTAFASKIIADPSVNLVANGFTGHAFVTQLKATSNKNVAEMDGTDLYAIHSGSGIVTDQFGLDLFSGANGSGTITNNRALSIEASAQGTSGIVSNAGLELISGSYAGASVTNDYTLKIRSPLRAGTLTTHYGILLENQEFGGTSYALFANGGIIYSAGNIGIGVINPAQALDLIGGITWRGVSSTPLSFGSEGRIYFDSDDAVFKVSENGQAYANLVSERTGFVQNGNSFGANAVIGTNDGFSLIFEINNTDNWRMDISGIFRSSLSNPDPRIGINVAAPSSALDIEGALTIQAIVAPALSSGSSGRVYYDSIDQRFKLSENGGTYINVPRPTEVWGVSGNAGTNPSSNFFGTTDDIDFAFKRNNLTVQRVYTGGATIWTGSGAGPVPVSGAGVRMVWTPLRSSLRAGTVTGSEWDDANTGVYSFAAGFNPQASGSASVSLGKNTTASAIDSFASGEDAKATMQGQFARASGGFGAVKGSAQMSILIGSAETSNNVQTEMSLSPAVSTYVSLDNDSTYAVDGTVVARNTGSDTECSMWNVRFICFRGANAATTTVMGVTVTPVYEALIGAWLVTVVADVANGRFAVKVTGENGKSIRWVSHLIMTEVKG